MTETGFAQPTLRDRFEGAILGVALGDALGAPHEGGILGGALWALLGVGQRGILRWTDDTQMTLGLIDSLLACSGIDADHLARTWARRFELRRGYGGGAIRLLRRINAGEDWRIANRHVFPDGSFGNGAAMRAVPIGLYYHRDLSALRQAAKQASEITHAHPLGIEGGVLIAHGVALAMQSAAFAPAAFVAALREQCTLNEYRTRLDRVSEWQGEEGPEPRVVQAELGCSVLAHESAVTAVYAFLRHRDSFLKMMDFIVSLGGDTDTIGAMAGGLFGAHHGVAALPADLLARLEQMPHVREQAQALHDHVYQLQPS